MFISKTSLCNSVYGNTLYASRKNLNKMRKSLKMDFITLRKWYYENHMTLNPEECPYMIIGSKDPPHKIKLNNNEITSSNKEKLLGILLNSRLNFESHISSLCRKAGQKVNALASLKN